MKELNQICFYVKDRIDISLLNEKTYISTENMLQNKEGVTISSNIPKVGKTQAYKKGDILISNIRPYFKKIWYATWDGGCSGDVLVIRAKQGISSRYLYTILSDNRFFTYSMASSKGTKMPRGDKESIMKYRIPDFNPEEQEKISKIVFDINDKIRINNGINDNLLNQAITIFNGFIDGKEKNGCIGDYCTVKSGFAFKSNWWTESGVKVIKIGSINQDELDLNSCSFVGKDKVEKAKEFCVVGGDLLIAMTGATIGKFTMVPSTNEPILVNQRVGKFFLGRNPIERLPYIYCTLKQPDVFSEVINRGQGSAQPNISGGDIMSIPCVILNNDLINDFNKKTQSLFNILIDNQKENKELSELRDTLLPKLMTGEIDLSNINLDL